MNLKSLLEGMAFGALIAVGVTVWEHYRAKPLPPMPPIVHTGPAFSASAASQVAVPKSKDAQDAWLQRRNLEFDKCDEMHGTPTLGFGMRVVCLDSHAVKFVGEEHPPYE